MPDEIQPIPTQIWQIKLDYLFIIYKGLVSMSLYAAWPWTQHCFKFTHSESTSFVWHRKSVLTVYNHKLKVRYRLSIAA